MATALITHAACLEHDPGPYHPESPARLRAVLKALEAHEFDGLIREEAPRATREQLMRVHPEAVVDMVLSIRPEQGDTINLDADTAMSSGAHHLHHPLYSGVACCVLAGNPSKKPRLI